MKKIKEFAACRLRTYPPVPKDVCFSALAVFISEDV